MTKQITCVAPLSNIKCDECELGDGISIARTPKHMHNIIEGARKKLSIRDPSDFPFCLVVRQSKDEIREIKQARENVEEIILLLRLFKRGDIYYNYVLHDEAGWFDDPNQGTSKLQSMGIFFFKSWSNLKFQISQEELEHLIDFVKVHRGKEVLKKRAFYTFFRGYHEPYTEDRFLRNAIGLENVFVNDTEEQSNIRYKFIDRGCYLLQLAEPHDEGAGAYAKPLRDIYDIRCKIVHSNEVKIDWNKQDNNQILTNADLFLRLTLRLLLLDPDLGKGGEIDKRKRACYKR